MAASSEKSSFGKRLYLALQNIVIVFLLLIGLVIAVFGVFAGGGVMNGLQIGEVFTCLLALCGISFLALGYVLWIAIVRVLCDGW